MIAGKSDIREWFVKGAADRYLYMPTIDDFRSVASESSYYDSFQARKRHSDGIAAPRKIYLKPQPGRTLTSVLSAANSSNTQAV